MPSQIKVDEIKNVAGQYEIKTNTFKGQTTAGSITVQGENTATTNLQQGLAKQWFNNSSGASPRDSFNVSGITDNQTGDDTYSYTNNMNDANHAVVPAGWRDHDHYHAANETMLSTSSSRVRAYVRGGNSTVDSGFKCCAVFGDLA